ncbi:DoxX family protein [Streptomyces sp. A244]|uniref:DoxX family protein n=1 Tax=Streptomyces TaxID=1883 RepID=UPI0021595EDD|nr:DoxX family protein [Streptomyces sp. A244]
MRTAHITLAVALALVFVPLGLAKIATVPFMRQAAAHLDMSPGLYRIIGTLEVRRRAARRPGSGMSSQSCAARPGRS